MNTPKNVHSSGKVSISETNFIVGLWEIFQWFTFWHPHVHSVLFALENSSLRPRHPGGRGTNYFKMRLLWGCIQLRILLLLRLF